jgi:hypothetical protein
MELKKYLQKIHVESRSIDELDFILYDEFDINNEDVTYEIIEVGQGITSAYVINIDTMITNLMELKDKGTTHVEIDYHEDHIGYDISTYIMRESTIDEINKIVIAKTKQEIIDEKRLDLLRQLTELDHESYSKINNDDLPF